VGEVLEAARRSLGADAERVRLALDEDLPPLSADPAQLERAFANLLENGVLHGGGEQVLVRSRLVGPRLVVRVVDRGPGIPAGESERIFEPFYRSPHANGHRTGSGLGLAIAKGFVEAQRRRGRGRVAPRAGGELRGQLRGAGGRGIPVSAQPRVLVCDDEPQILRRCG
jgi:two-component system, OmpR family, sensor histidine kinase KdpD